MSGQLQEATKYFKMEKRVITVGKKQAIKTKIDPEW